MYADMCVCMYVCRYVCMYVCIHAWCGRVGYGMEWYGGVWYGLVWYDMSWYGMVWYVMYVFMWSGMYVIFKGNAITYWNVKNVMWCMSVCMYEC